MSDFSRPSNHILCALSCAERVSRGGSFERLGYGTPRRTHPTSLLQVDIAVITQQDKALLPCRSPRSTTSPPLLLPRAICHPYRGRYSSPPDHIPARADLTEYGSLWKLGLLHILVWGSCVTIAEWNNGMTAPHSWGEGGFLGSRYLCSHGQVGDLHRIL